jgi:hypothetical protein
MNFIMIFFLNFDLDVMSVVTYMDGMKMRKYLLKLVTKYFMSSRIKQITLHILFYFKQLLLSLHLSCWILLFKEINGNCEELQSIIFNGKIVNLSYAFLNIIDIFDGRFDFSFLKDRFDKINLKKYGYNIPHLPALTLKMRDAGPIRPLRQAGWANGFANNDSRNSMNDDHNKVYMHDHEKRLAKSCSPHDFTLK